MRTCQPCRRRRNPPPVPWTPEQRQCEFCDGEYTADRPQRRYCRPECRWAARELREFERYGAARRNSGNKTPEQRRGRAGKPYLRLRRQVRDEEPTCWLCGYDIDPETTYPHPDSFSLDHVVPLVDGGELLARENVHAAHLRCNTQRGRRAVRMAA